ncbi:MAG: hypothetical protein ABFC67_08590 [Mizugakiibacter sp.]|uniref:hypothetical protein n=1 Tax=Mizugakiibacter sp. TaxID=1972610 RepID=UPI0031BF409E|nr:hypothetical protein [Xanthomonadaceae bacterium]
MSARPDEAVSPAAFAHTSAALVATFTPVIRGLDFHAGNRVWFSLSLLKSSIDIAHAALTLIATDDENNGMGAVVLLRPQLEHMFRAIYLGSDLLASDNFLHKFERGAADFPPFQSLSELAAAHLPGAGLLGSISENEFGRLPRMVAFIKKDLHGFVHGGIKVIQAYEHETGIAFDVEHFDNGHLVVNVTACALLAFSFTQTLSPTTWPQVGETHPKEVGAFLTAYEAWIQAAKAIGSLPQEA